MNWLFCSVVTLVVDLYDLLICVFFTCLFVLRFALCFCLLWFVAISCIWNLIRFIVASLLGLVVIELILRVWVFCLGFIDTGGLCCFRLEICF